MGAWRCYVDRLIDYTGRVPYRHKVWCHLVADPDELLAGAGRARAAGSGCRGRRGWDTHFDVPAPLRRGRSASSAREVDFRFMALRTRARRHRHGPRSGPGGGRGPTGSVMEVPLPESDGWRAAAVPDGVTVTWRHDHPLLVGRSVAVLSAGEERSGVVSFARGSTDAAVDVAARLVESSPPRGDPDVMSEMHGGF